MTNLLTFRGDWRPNFLYLPGDVVSRAGVRYVAVEPPLWDEAPAAGCRAWQLLVVGDRR